MPRGHGEQGVPASPTSAVATPKLRPAPGLSARGIAPLSRFGAEGEARCAILVARAAPVAETSTLATNLYPLPGTVCNQSGSRFSISPRAFSARRRAPSGSFSSTNWVLPQCQVQLRSPFGPGHSAVDVTICEEHDQRLWLKGTGTAGFKRRVR